MESARRVTTENQDEPGTTLVQKIRQLLERTDPEKWERHDQAFNPEKKMPKPRQAWERAYTLRIQKGTLLLRCSMPVKADYVAGGFVLTPTGPERYTVEMRAPNWEATVLIDPYVAGGTADKRCEILAEGRIAQELFTLMASRIQQHVQNRHKLFVEKADALLRSLPELLRRMNFELWQKKEDVKGSKSYTATIENVSVTIAIENRNGEEHYVATLTKADLTHRSQDYSLCKRIYEGLEEQEQNSGLLALSAALEGVLE